MKVVALRLCLHVLFVGATCHAGVCLPVTIDAVSAGRSLLQIATLSQASSNQSQQEKSNLTYAGSSNSSFPPNSMLYYQIHVPRTAGSIASAILFADICHPWANSMERLGWSYFCTQTCERGLLDNEYACHTDAQPSRIETLHEAFAFSQRRAEDVKTKRSGKDITYVTTLRRGSDRVISQWLKELFHGAYVPPDPITALSERSLVHYVRSAGIQNTGGGWIASQSVSQRNNMGVAIFASLNQQDSTRSVTLEDLETAKKTLLSGKWIIGFAECLKEFHMKLEKAGSLPHGGFNRKELPPRQAPDDELPFDRSTLSEDTLEIVRQESAFDNELYEWAWNEAKKGTDPRWSGPC